MLFGSIKGFLCVMSTTSPNSICLILYSIALMVSYRSTLVIAASVTFGNLNLSDIVSSVTPLQLSRCPYDNTA